MAGLKQYGDGQTYQGGESSARTGGGIMGEAAKRGPSYETTPATDAARQWEGWGSALKPAWEPVILARKPLEGTIAQNVLAWGTGGLNIDGCRVHAGDAQAGRKRHGGGIAENHTSFVLPDSDHESPAGRWPANLILQDSPEVLAGFPQAKGQQGALTGAEPSSKTANAFGEFAGRAPSEPRGDTGSAARFFYCAKASRKDRDEGLDGFAAQYAARDNGFSDKLSNSKSPRANTHATVKPTDLMRYLCRLVTPPGGTVFDPFTGSGSTGKAAVLEGFSFIGCELDAEYVAIARARIAHALSSKGV